MTLPELPKRMEDRPTSRAPRPGYRYKLMADIYRHERSKRVTAFATDTEGDRYEYNPSLKTGWAEYFELGERVAGSFVLWSSPTKPRQDLELIGLTDAIRYALYRS